MNFRIGRLICVTSKFILGALLFSAGISALILPRSVYFQTVWIRFITENAKLLTVFGSGLILLGIFLIVRAYRMAGAHTIEILINGRSVLLEENLVRQYLERYWKEHFPDDQIPMRLKIKKNAIRISARLPFMPSSEQQPFLDQVQTDLQDIFSRLLGYNGEIRLIAEFRPEEIK